ncbi:helix-turn-helix domain-containing protein (plasmid) [Agrobacterium tumefaciens]|uniref:helix-turn-helix domain-containing protein n=1 Tax=Agrobacterium tumefaciens TaxID=358 RepID=UPI0013B43AEF|nr:helix-turn-helix domain-containing protein [Agrobacterium tumefaciens]WQE43516.1 helix-turn-helix domain-containing protein [Agrobacterium tumefaciens]
MEITLSSHPELSRMQQGGVLRFEDVDVEAEQTVALLSHTVERSDDRLRVVVDHSYFTAKRTIFEVSVQCGEQVTTRVVAAVQEAVIAVQTKTVEMLASVNAAVINSLDDREIVHSVLAEVMNVLPHADAGVFRLFDEESGYLIPVSHQGLPDDYTHYRLQPNESVSGEVFVTGVPAIHNGRQNIIDAHRVMSPESQSFMERSRIANALLCVPVAAEGKRLGTLTTLCFSPRGTFSPFDRTILESLASQVAVAYQRSLAYKNAIATSSRLEKMRSDLASKNAELDRAVELHDKLLRIFSTSGSLVGRLDLVAGLFGVEFRFENVLGVDYRSRGWADHRDRLEQIVEVAEAPVGFFYFRAIEDRNFQRALFGTLSAFVALDFVRDMSRLDVLNASKRSYFDDLLKGVESRGRLEHFGFRPDRFHQIMIAKTSGTLLPDVRLSLHRSQSEIQNAIKLSNALVFHRDDEIVMVFSASTASALARNVTSMMDGMLNLNIQVGASVVYDMSGYHAVAEAQAHKAAECLARRGRLGILSYQDLGIEVLLSGRDRREIINFARAVLSPLLHNPKHDFLYDTLRTYVQEGKSVARAAGLLEIHSNTLYQRLARIEALTGRKISDAEDFTLLSVACQLYSSYSG